MQLTLLEDSPLLLIGLTGLLGVMVGSFLNVVIYRLPIMLRYGWRVECLVFLGLPAEAAPAPVNLLWPGSHCPACQTVIKAYDNIPLLSYLLLGGRCRACGEKISLRYPLVELLAGFSAGLLAWRFGWSPALGFALILSWALLALSAIDIDQQLLPDSICLPVLWLGLLVNVFSVFSDCRDAIIGAIAGYLSLWIIYQLFKLLTGKEGMGYGDFKLLALCGAWLGWQVLPIIVLMASLFGTLAGIYQLSRHKLALGQPMAFGPYLAAAGWLALVWGQELNSLYLQVTGL